MVPIASLWLPILVSAVLVFVVSSLIHMVLTYHRSDFGQLPREGEVRDALRPFDLPPGEYVVPWAADPKQREAPDFVEKLKQGPVALMTVYPNGPTKMGASLAQWFVYCIVVGLFAAYISGRALGPGADYPAVFRFAGCTAFVGYALALWQNSIWYKRSWSTTLKSTLDGLVYGLLTAGAFGAFWPG